MSERVRKIESMSYCNLNSEVASFDFCRTLLISSGSSPQAKGGDCTEHEDQEIGTPGSQLQGCLTHLKNTIFEAADGKQPASEGSRLESKGKSVKEYRAGD